jgi:hypothetical protein
VQRASISGLLSDCSTAVRAGHNNTAASASELSLRAFSDLHKTDRHWGVREDFFARHIPADAVVLDLGAGAMHLRSRLNASHHYIPVDGTFRRAAEQRVCNFNDHEYPLRVKPVPTVVVAQGVSEYVSDKLIMLRALVCAYPAATFLVSYTDLAGNHIGSKADIGFTASLTLSQLEAMFRRLGLTITHNERCMVKTHDTFGHQCYRLVAEQAETTTCALGFHEITTSYNPASPLPARKLSPGHGFTLPAARLHLLGAQS